MADIEMLQTLHGDAFIIHCQKGKSKGIVVVDGGPNRNSRDVVSQLDALGTIDLMVLTHYDDDHIEGILAYIKKHKADKPFTVKQRWVNCAYDVPVYTSPNISLGQAQKLADELKKITAIHNANIGKNYTRQKKALMYAFSGRCLLGLYYIHSTDFIKEDVLSLIN